MSDPPWSLDDLRRQIDEVDTTLHDLLIRRAEIVEAVGALKKHDRTPAIRPGREAQILRRLLARHKGSFPRTLVVRIWREILSGTIALQVDFAVAVYAPDAEPSFWDLARDHYGSHTPMTAYGTASQVLRAMTEGAASVGVLPMPEEGDRNAWWPHLISTDAQTPRVIARLPFGSRGNARGEGGDALAIGRGEMEATGLDRSLLVIETKAEMSRARLVAVLKAGGLEASFVTALEHKPGIASNLLEFDGIVSAAEPSLTKALAPLGNAVDGVFSLGGYARPLTSEELAEPGRGKARRRG